MNAWKTILTALLSAGLLLTLSACGKSEDNAKESGTSVPESGASTDASSEETLQSESNFDSTADSNSDSTSNDEIIPESEAPTESSLEDMSYDLEYAEDSVPNACAQTIAGYFYAIETQNYPLYREYLYDYYAEQIDAWLNENYGYGIESAMESFHQMLTDAAGTENYTITGITMEPAQAASEDDANFLQDYLDTYNALLGDDFADYVNADVDEVLDIAVTLIADCDGAEQEIVTENEVLIVVKDGEYRILG